MNADISFGIAKELENLDRLSNFFNLSLKKTPGEYNIFDFECDDTLVELKGRRCKHDTYPDTMVGYNKIAYALEHPEKTFIFCFSFQDGLYYHKFNRELDYTPRTGGRCDRGRPEYKKYTYIPITKLLKI
jgi:hypothetical protein